MNDENLTGISILPRGKSIRFLDRIVSHEAKVLIERGIGKFCVEGCVAGEFVA